jgi:membrane associated rhomboid family serine protease
MLPARIYWARFLLHLALGFLAGLLVGELVQALTDVPGWAVFGATTGLIVGLFLFMLRRDT